MKAAVTGTPGTGKTVVSKRLARMTDLEYIPVNGLAREKGCVLSEDVERDTQVIDVNGLRQQTSELDNCILDGHLSHFLEPDVAFVLRCRPSELRKRLKGKDWEEEKIDENVDAEILGVIDTEARDRCDEVYSVDTTGKEPEQTAEILKKITDGDDEARDKHLKKVDWIGEGEI